MKSSAILACLTDSKQRMRRYRSLGLPAQQAFMIDTSLCRYDASGYAALKPWTKHAYHPRRCATSLSPVRASKVAVEWD